MRDNEHVLLKGKQVLLVPYCRKHVEKYHNWMQDSSLLELTASEPLSLSEEYEMQDSWRVDPQKCTFIVLSRQCSGTEVDAMIGDVNVFLNDPEDPSRVELDVMIAEADSRGKGRGQEAVLLMMWYCVRDLKILKFYCKIHEANSRSLNLFQRLGFIEVNYVKAFQEYELSCHFLDLPSFQSYFLENYERCFESIECHQYDENAEFDLSLFSCQE